MGIFLSGVGEGGMLSKLDAQKKRTEFFVTLSAFFHLFAADIGGDFLIPLENIPRVNLVFHVVKHSVITVGKDCAALRLEFFDVVDHD